MNNHALIVTADYKFLPGVNALINGCRFYGNEVDLYLLFWDKEDGPFHQYIDQHYTDIDFVYPIDLRELIHRDSILVESKAKFYLKFWRHYYPEKLLDYKSIAIFDADMMIVNHIMDYFEIAAKTGRILIPRNTSAHAQEIDNYSQNAFIHSYSPPCHSMPLFYDPKLHYLLFQEVPELARKMGRGEMVAINRLFHDKRVYDDLILLPNSLWLGTRWKDLEYEILHGNDDMRHLTICGDRVFSIHGRWWAEETLAKIGQGDQIGRQNGKMFQEMYQWLGQLPHE